MVQMMSDFGDQISAKELKIDSIAKIMRGSISVEDTLKAFGSQKTSES